MKKTVLIPVALLIVLVAIGGFFILSKSKNESNEMVEEGINIITPIITETPTPQATSSSVTITPTTTKAMTDTKPVTELKVEDLKVGTGVEAVAGKTVTVNYKGTLTDGSQFDSSYDRGTPFTFNLGAGQVIQGWDQGVVGMKVGGKRKLTIPSSLGYGSRDLGTIPPNSTLIFEIELLKVE